MIKRHTAGRERRSGNALIEFTLVGIPILFILISIFEVARGMWMYTTLQHAVEDTVRFSIVHGDNCSANGNTCQVTVSQVLTRLNQQSGMFDPALLQLELRSGCNADASYTDTCGSTKTGTLQSLLADATAWPDDAAPGIDAIEIYASYPFVSVIGVFWPSSGGGQTFGTFNLQAISRETVQF